MKNPGGIASGVGGGDKEIRTPDLFIANEPLYQLSYIPVTVVVVVAEGGDSSGIRRGSIGLRPLATTDAAGKVRPHHKEPPCPSNEPWSCSSPMPSNAD